jgi:triosephosphate isomerase
MIIDMVMGTAKAYEQGTSCVICIGKNGEDNKTNKGKEFVFTDELTEDEVKLFVMFKKVKKGWN